MKSKIINPYHSKELKMVNFVKSKQIIMKDTTIKEGKQFYDGTNFINDVGNTFSYKSDYTDVICPFCDGVPAKNRPHKNIKECYNCFITTNEELKRITKNCKANKKKIDLSKTGIFSNTFFYMMSEYHCDKMYNSELLKKIPTFTFPTFNEYQWYLDLNTQLIWADRTNKFSGDIVGLDKNSF